MPAVRAILGVLVRNLGRAEVLAHLAGSASAGIRLVARENISCFGRCIMGTCCEAYAGSGDLLHRRCCVSTFCVGAVESFEVSRVWLEDIFLVVSLSSCVVVELYNDDVCCWCLETLVVSWYVEKRCCVLRGTSRSLYTFDH